MHGEILSDNTTYIVIHFPWSFFTFFQFEWFSIFCWFGIFFVWTRARLRWDLISTFFLTFNFTSWTTYSTSNGFYNVQLDFSFVHLEFRFSPELIFGVLISIYKYGFMFLKLLTLKWCSKRIRGCTWNSFESFWRRSSHVTNNSFF